MAVWRRVSGQTQSLAKKLSQSVFIFLGFEKGLLFDDDLINIPFLELEIESKNRNHNN
jgi:hypothetical protein